MNDLIKKLFDETKWEVHRNGEMTCVFISKVGADNYVRECRRHYNETDLEVVPVLPKGLRVVSTVELLPSTLRAIQCQKHSVTLSSSSSC